MEYDTARSSAIWTQCLYYDVSEGIPYGSSYKKDDWVEYYDFDTNGKKITVQKITMKSKYIFDEKGNFVELHSIDKKGRMKLLRKRIIKYN